MDTTLSFRSKSFEMFLVLSCLCNSVIRQYYSSQCMYGLVTEVTVFIAINLSHFLIGTHQFYLVTSLNPYQPLYQHLMIQIGMHCHHVSLLANNDFQFYCQVWRPDYQMMDSHYNIPKLIFFSNCNLFFSP